MREDSCIQRCLVDLITDSTVGLDTVHRDRAWNAVCDEGVARIGVQGHVYRPLHQRYLRTMWRQRPACRIDPKCAQTMSVARCALHGPRPAIADRNIQILFRYVLPRVLRTGWQLGDA